MRLMQSNVRKILDAIHLPQAEWIGLRKVLETTKMHQARDAKPEHNAVCTNSGFMVEVLADGQFAYAASPTEDQAHLQKAAELAYLQAKKAAVLKSFHFSQAQRPAVQGSYQSAYRQPQSPSYGDLNDLLIQITQKLKISEKIISTTASARIVDTHFQYASTNGSNIEQNFLLMSKYFSATAQEGSIVQTRNFEDNLQTGFEFFDEIKIWPHVDRIAQQVLELLTADECPTTTCDLLLMPDQMMLQIHESIGHPLEIDRILGDERNYAGSSFVKLTDFGKLQYGSKHMNITFDPSIPNEFASYNFDDIGNPAKREFLIKDGILLRGLGSLESQARAHVPGVANQRACSWNRPPIDRMANLNLEPGNASLEELIGSIKKGIVMETNRSWSIDDYRNKFQFGCEYAKLIENGKLTKTVRNPNYRGISNSFWKSLKAVGNKNTSEVHGTPNCGKGEPNQVIRVGHASPACLFENVEVFGGAQ